LDWLECYERYNYRDEAELRPPFEIYYLERTAQKLFLFSNIQADCIDQPAVAAMATAAAIPLVTGLRTFFLQKFRQERMRKHFQCEKEDKASYYHDFLYMCHVINPAMSQTQQLEHLYNVLWRSLLKKIYRKKHIY
jgi:hypothetical protein